MTAKGSNTKPLKTAAPAPSKVDAGGKPSKGTPKDGRLKPKK
jgi:hypothetical protein